MEAASEVAGLLSGTAFTWCSCEAYEDACLSCSLRFEAGGQEGSLLIVLLLTSLHQRVGSSL